MLWFRTKVIAATVAPQAINDARNVIPTLSQRFGYFDSCGVEGRHRQALGYFYFDDEPPAPLGQ